MRLGLNPWLARRSDRLHAVAQARSDIQHHLRQQMKDYRSRGNGNRARRRLRHLEREFRQSGGFYVSDFIPHIEGLTDV